jgi:hypothetical protein
MRTGRTVKRKITLHGLAWRSQVAWSILNNCPIVLSKVIGFIVRFVVLLPKNGGHTSSGMTTLNRYGAAHVFYYFWGYLL